MENKETTPQLAENKAPVPEETKPEEAKTEEAKEHKVELRLKEKIKLDKTTSAWLKAHTQIDINSNAILNVASKIFSSLRDEMEKPGMTVDKIIANCDRCPCATHEALKTAALMLKNHLVGES